MNGHANQTQHSQSHQTTRSITSIDGSVSQSYCILHRWYRLPVQWTKASETSFWYYCYCNTLALGIMVFTHLLVLLLWESHMDVHLVSWIYYLIATVYFQTLLQLLSLQVTVMKIFSYLPLCSSYITQTNTNPLYLYCEVLDTFISFCVQ